MSAHFESCPVIAPQNTSCDAKAHHSAPVIVLAAGVHAALLCVQVSAGLVQRFCYFAGHRRRAKISDCKRFMFQVLLPLQLDAGCR